MASIQHAATKTLGGKPVNLRRPLEPFLIDYARRRQECEDSLGHDGLFLAPARARLPGLQKIGEKWHVYLMTIDDP